MFVACCWCGVCGAVIQTHSIMALLQIEQIPLQYIGYKTVKHLITQTRSLRL